MRSWILAAVFSVVSSGAMAEMQCDRALLADMATEILTRRGELKGFSGANVGGDAAYFMLRYKFMGAADVLALLQNGRPYKGRDDPILAQRISALGPAGIAFWGEDPSDILMWRLPSAQRAILLLDNGATYFGIMREIEADAKRAEKLRSIEMSLFAVLTDQPPEVLQQIAERAEREGHLVVAASLYAMLQEGAYEQFWERIRNSDFQPIGPASPSAMNWNGAIALARDTALPSANEAEPIEERLERQRQFQTLKAGLAEAGTQIILLSTNQSGHVREMALVSERFLAAIEAQEIDPKRHPEEGWAFLLSAMNDVLGAEDSELFLSRFSQSADHRHYGGKSLEVLQMATAVAAAGPWLRGEVEDAPGKPKSLSGSFDWAQALAVWSLVKANVQLPPEALRGQILSLAVEGHLQRLEIEAALALAERGGGLNGRLDVARDIMLRQNRLCDQYGIMPGASILLAGALIYDFQ